MAYDDKIMLLECSKVKQEKYHYYKDGILGTSNLYHYRETRLWTKGLLCYPWAILMLLKVSGIACTVVPLLVATLNRGHPL